MTLAVQGIPVFGHWVLQSPPRFLKGIRILELYHRFLVIRTNQRDMGRLKKRSGPVKHEGGGTGAEKPVRPQVSLTGGNYADRAS
jgi:hypothetical protein